MSRISLIDLAAADPKAQMVLEKIQAAQGRVPNIFRAMAHSPAALQGFMGFRMAMAGSALSPKLKEKIGLLAAEINRCEYCISAHVPAAKKAGVDDIGIAQARKCKSEDPVEAAALKLAAQMLRHHGHINDAQFTAARQAGLSEGQIVELVAHVALNIFTNYFNDVAQTEIDFPKVESEPALGRGDLIFDLRFAI